METGWPDASPSLSALGPMAWMALVLMVLVRLSQTPWQTVQRVVEWLT